MDRKEKSVLLKNALANLVRGGAAALVAVGLPPFLTRLMSPDFFGAWSLVLQLAAYVAYLDFGIQTAVGRFVAHTTEKKDTEHRDRIVSTSAIILIVAGILGLVGIAMLAALLPHIFRSMPLALIGDTRIALLLVGGSLALGLPASIFNGIFVGLQRNEVPAAIIGASRLFAAVLQVLIVRHGGDLAQLGFALACVNLASYVLQYLMYRKMLPGVRFSARLVSSGTIREVFDYCMSLTVWSFGMLLVTGLDLTLVAVFQFEAVAYYAVAGTLVTLVSGSQNAIFSAMVPSTAVLHARGDSAGLGRTMITATRYGTFLLLLTGLPLILAGQKILTLWVGPDYAARGVHILEILTTANIIRLSLTPYAVTLIGTGQQRLVMFIPLLEGFSNLMLSIALGVLMGAIGVAIGTLVGSLVVFAGSLLYSMPRTTDIQFKIPEYLRDGLLRPLACAAPCVLFASAVHILPTGKPVLTVLAAVLALFTSLLCFWRWGLVRSERRRLKPRFMFVEGTR